MSVVLLLWNWMKRAYFTAPPAGWFITFAQLQTVNIKIISTYHTPSLLMATQEHTGPPLLWWHHELWDQWKTQKLESLSKKHQALTRHQLKHHETSCYVNILISLYTKLQNFITQNWIKKAKPLSDGTQYRLKCLQLYTVYRIATINTVKVIFKLLP